MISVRVSDLGILAARIREGNKEKYPGYLVSWLCYPDYLIKSLSLADCILVIAVHACVLRKISSFVVSNCILTYPREFVCFEMVLVLCYIFLCCRCH